MKLEERDGCKIDIESGTIIKKCGNNTRVVCIPGTITKGGGLNLFGTGGNVDYGHPDFKCMSMDKINKKIRSTEKN